MDIGEELEHDKSFLKGRNLTALWNAFFNYVDIENMREHKHGLLNTVMLKGNQKTVAEIMAPRMVDANAKGIKTSEAQHERVIRKNKIIAQIIQVKLKELASHIKSIKAIDVVVTVDFNEYAYLKNMQ